MKIDINGTRCEIDALEGRALKISPNGIHCEDRIMSDFTEGSDKVLNIHIHGNIDGDLIIDMGDVHVSGSIWKDVHVTNGDLSVHGDIFGHANVDNGDIKCRTAGVYGKPKDGGRQNSWLDDKKPSKRSSFWDTIKDFVK